MLEQSTFRFLADLRKHNNREWFEANRSRYEAAKTNFYNLTAEWLAGIAKWDSTVAHMEPRDCIFRINRDVRFSKDKSPYKTNMGAYISPLGKNGVSAGYYFHCEPGGSLLAGGLWYPPASALKKVRQEIDYNWDAFQTLLKNRKFKAVFGDLEFSGETTLTRPPKGYDAENPAIRYLKLKSIIASTKLTDEALRSTGIAKTMASNCAALLPLVRFLNEAIREDPQ